MRRNRFQPTDATPVQAEPGLVHAEFTRQFGEPPRMYRAPGRINIIGEHLDYNGGQVLPSTVDLFTWAAVAPRDDDVLEVHLCNTGFAHRIDLRSIGRDAAGDVIAYLQGVAWAMQQEGLETRGCNLVIGGNIPLGGGLSSSASLELLLAYVLADRSEAPLDRARLARLCHRAEAEYVGVQCGIMDQYAIALGESGHAMLLDCRSGEFVLDPLPGEAVFLVTHCGVSHRLPAGGYNARRQECSAALSILSAVRPALRFLSELTPDKLEQSRGLLSDTLFRRCRHVVTEQARVEAAHRAMLAADLEGLGRLMDESHRSLRDDYEVSCPELDALVEVTAACDGVLGARMMGGGFGGCAISLVRREAVDATVDRIRRDYGRVLGHEPWMHVVGPAGPVAEMEDGHEP